MNNSYGGWRELPPEYEPVHHEPRRRPDSRQPRPAWQGVQNQPQNQPQGQPQPPRQPHQPQWRQPHQPQWQQPQRQVPQPPAWQPAPSQHPGYDEQPYGDDGYSTSGGFVPGFAEGQDGPDDAEWQAQQAPQAPRKQQKQRRQKPAKRRGIRMLAPWIAVLVILTPVAIGGYYAYSLYQNKYHPADYSGDGTGTVQVQVKPGDTATSLAPELVNLGVIASSRALILAAEHSSSTAGMEPGYYNLHEHMQASLAYAILSNPKNIFLAGKVTLPEGLRKTAVIARLAAGDSKIPLSAYQQALTSKDLGLPDYAKGNPEGYLFPSQYQIPPHSTALAVLQQMVQRFNAEAATIHLAQGTQALRLRDPGEVMIVASLLQAEGGRLSDYPKIARVIYNRLAAGMPLQLDSTVFYGLGIYGTTASGADLKSNSPYNTYKFKGLPPSPIDSPGDAAIQAALHPANGNWLYFVTVNLKTGETKFTNSFTQFEQFRQELARNTGKG